MFNSVCSLLFMGGFHSCLQVLERLIKTLRLICLEVVKLWEDLVEVTLRCAWERRQERRHVEIDGEGPVKRTAGITK